MARCMDVPIVIFGFFSLKELNDCAICMAYEDRVIARYQPSKYLDVGEPGVAVGIVELAAEYNTHIGMIHINTHQYRK